MEKYSKTFLKDTIKTWQPFSPTPISLDDAREIIDNIATLFDLLINDDRKSKGIKN